MMSPAARVTRRSSLESASGTAPCLSSPAVETTQNPIPFEPTTDREVGEAIGMLKSANVWRTLPALAAAMNHQGITQGMTGETLLQWVQTMRPETGDYQMECASRLGVRVEHIGRKTGDHYHRVWRADGMPRSCEGHTVFDELDTIVSASKPALTQQLRLLGGEWSEISQIRSVYICLWGGNDRTRRPNTRPPPPPRGTGYLDLTPTQCSLIGIPPPEGVFRCEHFMAMLVCFAA